MKTGLFGSRALVVLTVLCGGSLVVGLLIGALGSDLTGVRSRGADSFSRSAIGHRRFVDLLRELEIPVTRHLEDPYASSRRGDLLIVAEPRFTSAHGAGTETWRGLYNQFNDILIILPKWTGSTDPSRPAWLAAMRTLPVADVQTTLDALGIDASIVRVPPDRTADWRIDDDLGDPALLGPQLLVSSSLTPIWSAGEGILVGRWRPDPSFEETIYVVADPDLFSNAGLGAGDNALRAVELVRRLDGHRHGVVLDESLHGFAAGRSIWKAFFEFPMSLVALQLALAGGALAWLATGRFGPVLEPEPTRGSGQEYLIENTAGLLHHGEHGGLILERYLAAAVSAVGRDLRLSAAAGSPAARETLLRIGRARNVTPDLVTLEDQVARLAKDKRLRESRLLGTAAAIHRWQREMTHGLH